MEIIKDMIKSYDDFPTKGIKFYDLWPVLGDIIHMQRVVEHVSKSVIGRPMLVAGMESRGLSMASHIASHFAVEYRPIRKAGKLPGATTRSEYNLEYGSGSIEVMNEHFKAGQNVMIVDDVLATGGTALAAADIINKIGCHVHCVVVLAEISSLNGRQRLEDRGIKVISGIEL